MTRSDEEIRAAMDAQYDKAREGCCAGTSGPLAEGRLTPRTDDEIRAAMDAQHAEVPGGGCAAPAASPAEGRPVPRSDEELRAALDAQYDQVREGCCVGTSAPLAEGRVTRPADDQPHTDDEIRAAVQSQYAQAAEATRGCCAGTPAPHAEQIGYDAAAIADLPEGAELGLGCGNPTALAELAPGETVLDLGSGGGVDCFLAAKAVGPEGRVIGVDMTPEMLRKARANAAAGGYDTVAFRLGEIEHLPVADGTVDVILSNCVVNLSPDKPQVLRDAFRVLRPGGRLRISDVVALAPLPDEIRRDMALRVGCIAGAATVDELRGWLTEAGFVDVQITPRPVSAELVEAWAPGRGLEKWAAPADIHARKP